MMKTLFLAVLIAITTPLPVLALDTSKGFETDSVVLYQPDEALQARLGDVTGLANYIKELQAVCTRFFSDTKKPETLHIVVAVRPGNRARVWFVSSAQPKADSRRQELKRQLEAVRPCKVRNGPVAFAISAKLAGGDGKSRREEADFQPPIPKEWKDAVKGKKDVLIPDGFLDLVWPDKE